MGESEGDHGTANKGSSHLRHVNQEHSARLLRRRVHRRFVGGLSAVFGPDNSGLAVAGFCILLGIKHVPYGYRATDSAIALAFVLAAMVWGGWRPRHGRQSPA
ncbi:hypothetical protein [Bifidobacterium pseudolongum]|uniref:hypothetical protein n=1 Tax=Bifidobacterium pseudolongum TaxID=1694 RepID=UPI00126A5E4C|nr:hypothetical protein [Bifidobacterium pseudolongum]UNP90775.1 hypothetical protein MPY69_04730 [Bifidobacterium pseudolongum subsp. pseudolongum]WCA41517.1 hypothetical protein PGB23_03710 [Bifidobacterium pseudolongum subsp. pseudolongum]